MTQIRWIGLGVLGLLLTIGCGETEPPDMPELEAPQTSSQSASTSTTTHVPERQALFGDLHIHTRWSFDAYSLGVPVTPEDAYRYARGAAIDHVSGTKIQMQGPPLDFMALTEHSEYMGVSAAVDNPDHPFRDIGLVAELTSPDPQVSAGALLKFAQSLASGIGLPELLTDDVIKPIWARVVEYANEYNEPGVFTAMVGYEYSSMPDGQNLHRNIIFRADRVPERPFSSIDSLNPEDLWHWMDEVRASGIQLLAIPHNGNTSNGLMWAETYTDGRPIDLAYHELRSRNEPVAEVLQIKGQSETHPILSVDDEWADFEQFDRILGRMDEPSQPKGSFVRDALLTGIEYADRDGLNPYKLGLIGSSDGHNAASAVEESNYFGKIGYADGTPERRLKTEAQILPADAVSRWGAAGLAGVWAEANTRASIYDALARKETFSTSGPRIRVRLFAGWDFAPDDLNGDLGEPGYARGVPMGADLATAPQGQSPTFLIEALKDPNEAALQRVQIIKGWVHKGEPQERVIDVACAGNATVDPTSQRCNLSPVDTRTAACEGSPGATTLRTHWRDPNFDAEQRAFYYVRVLQVPTCRWSTYDAEQLGIEIPAHLPRMLQERAITSPVWYAPKPI